MIKLPQCPNCGSAFKLVDICKCGTLCCNECSINFICISCYVERNQNNEIRKYFDEKYGMKT